MNAFRAGIFRGSVEAKSEGCAQCADRFASGLHELPSFKGSFMFEFILKRIARQVTQRSFAPKNRVENQAKLWKIKLKGKRNQIQ